MKVYSIVVSLIFLSITTSVHAKKSYITDEFDIMLRSLPAMDAKIIKPLPTGTPLTVVIDDAGKAHSQVKMKDGPVGYVLTRFISARPAAKSQLAALKEQIKVLKQDPDNLKSKYVDLESNYTKLSQKYRNLIDEKDSVESSLKKIRNDSKNTVALSEGNERLEKQVEQLIIQLDDVRIQNEALKDNSDNKSRFFGAMIAFIGVILGWIFSKTGGKRRQW